MDPTTAAKLANIRWPVISPTMLRLYTNKHLRKLRYKRKKNTCIYRAASGVYGEKMAQHYFTNMWKTFQKPEE